MLLQSLLHMVIWWIWSRHVRRLDLFGDKSQPLFYRSLMYSTFLMHNYIFWVFLGSFKSPPLKTFLGLLLCYGRKTVAFLWICTEFLDYNAWKRLIIQMLPLYKLTYEARCYPLKYDKIWEDWWEVLTPASTCDTIFELLEKCII